MNITTQSTDVLSLVLQANQQVVDRYDSLIGTMSALATVFGIIIAIALAYSAYERYKVEREIREYKKSIKQANEDAQKSAQNIKNLSEQTEKRANDAKVKIGEMLNSPAVSKEELKTLERKVDEIRESAAYTKGVASASSILNEQIDPFQFVGIKPFLYSQTKTCEKCGVQYKDKSNPYDLTTVYMNQPSECPVCHHLNKESNYPFGTL